jgi:cadherin EGF LAG seven-pass G-type receptor 1
VIATDHGTPNRTGEVIVTISVVDLNDNNPRFINEPYAASVFENSTTGTTVIIIAATDPDINQNARLTYNITGGDDSDQFTIDPSTGVITVNNLLDRETKDTYTLLVDVVDAGSPNRNDTSSIAITVLDSNDNAPVIVSASTFYVNENVPLGSLVNTVSATDADIGENAALQYNLHQTVLGPAGKFALNAATGALTTASGVINREADDTYILWVKVTDDGYPQLTSQVNITVIINDKNDNNPTFSSSSYTTTVLESSNIGTTVITFTATDADISANSQFTFSITGDDALRYFQVDSSSGALTIVNKLDRENISTFDFYAKATDLGSPSLSSTVPVKVIVVDHNDNRPRFHPVFYSCEIPYDDIEETQVVTVTATDADKDENALMTFTMSNHDYFSLHTNGIHLS